MYCSPNYKSKKALKEALALGTKVSVFSPGMFPAPDNGKVTLEGPHYPKPHTWYATCIVANGLIIPGSVK